MSIASEITALQTNLTNAKNAVTTKGGTVGDTGLSGLASEIATIPTGGTPEVEKKDINFYDYDGTRVASWTLAELAEATALPENPTHDGLTADGWNWTLAQLKTQNTKMNVGQHYTPTDGKTHLFVTIDDKFKTPDLGLGINGTVTIDWGDGNTTTATGSDLSTNVESTHTYATAGNYEVKIDVPSDSTINIRGNGSTSHFWRGSENSANIENAGYGEQINEIWIGNNVKIGFGSSMVPFNRFCNMSKISIPLTTSVGDNANSVTLFTFNSGLEFVSLPPTATKFSIGAYAGLKHCSLPPAITELGVSCFANNIELEEIYLPNSIEKYQSNCFDYCERLNRIRISNSVTNIYQNVFIHDNGLHEIDLTGVSSVPTITNSTFLSASSCKGLTIKVPQSLLASFQSASQWSNYSAYMVGV